MVSQSGALGPTQNTRKKEDLYLVPAQEDMERDSQGFPLNTIVFDGKSSILSLMIDSTKASRIYSAFLDMPNYLSKVLDPKGNITLVQGTPKQIGVCYRSVNLHQITRDQTTYTVNTECKITLDQAKEDSLIVFRVSVGSDDNEPLISNVQISIEEKGLGCSVIFRTTRLDGKDPFGIEAPFCAPLWPLFVLCKAEVYTKKVTETEEIKAKYIRDRKAYLESY